MDDLDNGSTNQVCEILLNNNIINDCFMVPFVASKERPLLEEGEGKRRGKDLWETSSILPSIQSQKEEEEKEIFSRFNPF